METFTVAIGIYTALGAAANFALAMLGKKIERSVNDMIFAGIINSAIAVIAFWLVY